ncbi:hypothetical protein ECC02_012260 [Trypanosoma cruzi]|uniref:Trans-sialidase C-terminal domain-containing protein n=1 Tax=Trypanosoma cruzi TaxID=5693 RepID=A0A7J6XKN4_TRYCR|nr:hypothetical protein ECC02_012260 [Trypanosoma cruzi]
MWLSDLRRIYDVGPASAVGEKVAASTPLHSVEPQVWKDPIEARRLYCSYEVAAAEDGEYNIAFADLTEKLGEMKKLVAAWRTKEYGCGNERNNKNRSDCDDGGLTEGLVGFLSSTSTDSTWRDEYLCVNATVRGEVTSTPDGGLTFKGPGAGAEWPVGDMGPNQPHHFADKNFTLMAPVPIHEVPKAGSSSSIPLTGVKLHDTGHTVLFCLSYTNENKWEVTFNGDTQNLSGDPNRVQGRKYQVALGRDYYVKDLIV